MTAEMELEEGHVVITIKRNFSALIQTEVEPVGQWFHSYEASRNYIIGEDIEFSDSEGDEEVSVEVEIDDNIKYLRSLDPADWKNQDHYAVLGLKKYRTKASDEDIKKAYRMMVLRHHPDKRTGGGEEIRADDDYFTCITKAYEVLGNQVKRRSYDSIDPEFEDSVPVINTLNKTKFFEVFGPVFERNARWSTTKHVPLLGKLDDPKQKVDRFYNFWYDFDSWREFSYLDEEEKEKGQDREERRWIEKQNKSERARRRKEEMARIRKLVDNSYASDPRIARFREEEKERKLAFKKAKQEAIRQKLEEQERIQKEAEAAVQMKKDQEEAEQKAKLEEEKREREAAKKIVKKERKVLRTLCKDNNFFTNDASERVNMMMDVELLCEALQGIQLQSVNQRLLEASSDYSTAKGIIEAEVGEVRTKAKKEKEASINADSKVGSALGKDKGGSKPWATTDLQLLVKAVNLFPAGTTQRWEVVASYISQHSTTGFQRNAKAVLSKAKELQNSDQVMKEAANQNAFQNLDKSTNVTNCITDGQVSQRLETPQEMLGMNLCTWSADEQRLLEQALKTYSSTTTDRWDKIAECIPNRSKKDCMRRYKELVEMVKAKKAAQNAVGKK